MDRYDDRRRPRRGSDPRSGSRRGGRPPKNDLFHTAPSHERFERWKVVVLVFAAILVLGAVARLAWYDIFNADWYVAQATERRLTDQTVFAKRGTIYDRNGNVLATSVDCFNVAVNPRLVEDRDAVATALADVLAVDRAEAMERLSRDTTFVYIKKQVDQDLVDELRETGLAGFEYEPTVKRVYPYGNLASQVLGVVGNDNEGLTGLELYYNDILSGTDGSVVYEHGLYGERIAGGAYEETPAKDGTDIVLSIDANIQRAAEDAIAQAVEDADANYGSIIVTDPNTGEILAACSYPTYDQTDLANAESSALNLRVVTDSYEPGSTFKTLTAAMAVDSGSMTSESSIYVPAQVKVGDDIVTDVDDRDWGMDMTLREILRRSSNTGIALVGESMGADSFASYLEKFGIGSKTGVDFPGEVTGIVPAREDYTGASVGAMSFGQAVSVPPIQLVRAVGAIANGGTLKTPHFLVSKGGEKVDWSEGDSKAISGEAASSVADMMRTVVDEGTGEAGQVEGYDVSGKTGTAQRASESGGYEENNYMASFMGFAPTDDPQVLVYVTLDGTAGSGGGQAAPPFQKVMAQALDTLGVPKTR